MYVEASDLPVLPSGLKPRRAGARDREGARHLDLLPRSGGRHDVHLHVCGHVLTVVIRSSVGEGVDAVRRQRRLVPHLPLVGVFGPIVDGGAGRR